LALGSVAAGSLFVGGAVLDIELGDELVGTQQMAHRFGCAMGQEFHRLHRDAGQSRHRTASRNAAH